jgi:hypothetical protein
VTSTNTKIYKKKLQNLKFSHLPAFTPINNYKVYFINRSTDTNVLHDLIQLAQRTKYYSVDTEGDYIPKCRNKPSLIQFEFIHPQESIILLIEVCQLPLQHQQALNLWLIRAIFKYIFQPQNVIYSWGNARKELTHFIIYHLFNRDALYKPKLINVQDKFKEWHYNKYGFYKTGVHLWGLQPAIADEFNQFLNKNETLNIWSRGLYRPDNKMYNHKMISMINYAIDDCLAVTKLAQHIGNKVVS